jgi:hypothetical protein
MAQPLAVFGARRCRFSAAIKQTPIARQAAPRHCAIASKESSRSAQKTLALDRGCS